MGEKEEKRGGDKLRRRRWRRRKDYTGEGRSNSGGKGRIRDRDLDWRPVEKEGGVRIRVEKEEEGLERRKRSEDNRRIEMGIYWKQGGLTLYNGTPGLGLCKSPIPNKQPFSNKPLEIGRVHV